MKKITEEEALHRCAAYCSLAERCVQDVRRKLDVWEIEPDSQQRIVNRLQKEGFIDEERYCRSYVNDKTRFARWGKNKIVYALRAKGLPDAVIAEAVGAINPEKNAETLAELLKTKVRSVKGKDNYEIRMKLLRFAAGRGFELSSIYKCLDAMGL